MPKLLLTELVLQNVKLPTGNQVDYWDTSVPGFGLRVAKGGSKTFVVMLHRNRKAIGRYPTISLKQARDRAKRLLYEPAVSVEDEHVTVAYSEAVDRFLDAKEQELRASTLRDYKRILKRFSFARAVNEIRPHQVADAIDAIKKQTDKSLSFTVLKVFFNWCLAREYCLANPMQNLKKPKLPSSRDRVLSDEELAAIWHASWELDKYGAIVRLLMLTAQRAGQIAHLRTDWVHEDHIIFPAGVMKNEREHFCPLGPLGRYTLQGVLPVENYYFSPITAVGRPFSAWSKNKAKLDKLVQLDPWRLHDLRRTWSSNAPRLDIPPHISGRILSHAAPEGRMAKIYNRYKFREEMTDAMAKMDNHILSLIEA